MVVTVQGKVRPQPIGQGCQCPRPGRGGPGQARPARADGPASAPGGCRARAGDYRRARGLPSGRSPDIRHPRCGWRSSATICSSRPARACPLVADDRQWIATVVALIAELKSGPFARQTEQSLSQLVETPPRVATASARIVESTARRRLPFKTPVSPITFLTASLIRWGPARLRQAPPPVHQLRGIKPPMVQREPARRLPPQVAAGRLRGLRTGVIAQHLQHHHRGHHTRRDRRPALPRREQVREVLITEQFLAVRGQEREHASRRHRCPTSAPASSNCRSARSLPCMRQLSSSTAHGRCRARCRSATAGTYGTFWPRLSGRKSRRNLRAGQRACPGRRASAPPPPWSAGSRSTSCVPERGPARVRSPPEPLTQHRQAL